MGKGLVVILSAVLLTLSGFLSDCNHVAAAKEKVSANGAAANGSATHAADGATRR